MEINIIANNHAGIFAQLIYRITGADAAKIVEVEVLDTKGNTLGVKQLKGRESYDVNIAPYLRGQVTVEPFYADTTGFHRAEGRCMAANIRAMYEGEEQNAVYSELRTYNAGVHDQTPQAVISDAGGRLEIGLTEWDEIPIYSNEEYLKASVVAIASDVDRYTFTMGGKTGVANDPGYTVFVLNMADLYPKLILPERYAKVRVEVATLAGQVIAVREYVIARGSRTARFAWLNRHGAVDYYTFAALESTVRKVEKKTIYTPEGWRTVAAEEETVSVVRSAQESARVVEWLAGIVTSPRVWKVEGSGFIPVTVEGQDVKLVGEEAGTVEMKFRGEAKQRLQHD